MPEWMKGLGAGVLSYFWDEDEGVKYENIIPLLTAYGLSRAEDSDKISSFLGLNSPMPTGYMGGIPDYTYTRNLVPNAFAGYERDNAGVMALDAEEEYIPRRPGGAGRSYFTKGVFAPATTETTVGEEEEELISVCPPGSLRAGETIPTDAVADYCNQIHTTNSGSGTNSSSGEAVVLSDGAITTTEGTGSEYTNLAGGGLASLNPRGYYLGGRTDGMADRIPATINQRQPARLSDGEFVVPADVVSHLGNGSSNAGADQLFSMMDRVRKARTGRKSQGKKINPQRYLG